MISFFLFIIPSPLKWTTNQVANVIAIISATATVGALWYAYHRDRQQDKKINDLANIVGQLSSANQLQKEQIQLVKHQMMVEAQPKFAYIHSFMSPENDFNIHLKNVGDTAFITASECHMKGVTVTVDREEVSNGGNLVVVVKAQIWPANSFNILLRLHDKFHNYYGLGIAIENKEVDLQLVPIVAPLDRKVTTAL